MHTEICLVRHGVTDWNYEGRAQGRTDIPLNAEGLRQAEAVADRLSHESWDAIYSSTLSRAFQTAEAIARRSGHTVQPDARLVERDMGIGEGYTHHERLRRWPGKHFMDLPGVETNEAMSHRATEAILEIARRHWGQRVICVAHGGLIKAFLESLPVPQGAEPLKVFPGNTSVSRVVYDGQTLQVTATPDNHHVRVAGIEFSGEGGRIEAAGLPFLALMTGLPVSDLGPAVGRATAVESAWADSRMVAFARLFTDGVLTGYLDLVAALPEYRHLLPALIQRLEARYPGVPFVQMPLPAEERAGD